MRKNKFVKLLEHILVLLPLLFVASVCLYVIFNENAKDSYSVKYSETTQAFNSGNVNDLYVNGQIVNIKWNNSTYGTRSGVFGYSNIDIDVNQLLNTTNVNYVGFSFYTSSSSHMYFVDDTNVEHRFDNYKIVLENGFSYTVDLNTYTTKQIYNYALATTTTTISAPLDQAFTYSLDQFNQLGFDRINWVNWFTSIFITENNVYVTFLNSYLNYFLLVECCYVVPMVMYWFIHFCEHVLYKFENWGE